MIAELVKFKLVEGTDEPKFLRESFAMERDFLSKQPGFVSRSLLKGEGVWFDLAHWDSMENAKKASEKAMKTPRCLEFFKMMDQSSLEIQHLEKK